MTKQFDPLEALNLRYLVFPGPDTALRGLEQYLAAVDEQLSYLKGQYKVRFKAQLKRGAHGKDPEDIYLAKYNVDYLTKELFPRFIRGAYLISLWAALESSLTDMTDYAKVKYKQKFGLDEIRAGDFLVQAEKYYMRVLDMSLFRDRPDRERIETLKAIRNALVHDNGRIDGLPKNLTSHIKARQHVKMGFEVENGHIIPTEQGLAIYFSSVKHLLERTADSVFAKLHPNAHTALNQT